MKPENLGRQQSLATTSNRVDRLRIRHLRLLERIAESGSLSAAAQALGVSQPGATKMLQEIEAAFGASLIERTSRGARLNAVGASALSRLRIAIGALDAAMQALATQPTVPLVRVGMLPVIAVGGLPEIAAMLDGVGRLPRMVIREATVGRLISWLQEGEIDCVISTLEPGMKMMEGLEISPLWETSLEIAAAPNHPLARKRKVSIEQVLQARWILPPRGASVRMRLEQWFIEAGFPPPSPFIEAPSIYTRLSLVSSTSALSIAPQNAIKYYSERGMVHELRMEIPMPKGSMFFVTRDEKVQLAEVTLIKRALQELASSKF